ncbi:MAG TPA: hypothetical protein PLK90_11135 [Clostridiales bacterium]|nr:hypothetical protein [Clostridiales bacterium]HQP70942.1 hypothetical protein [Clostridiales bacterium]
MKYTLLISALLFISLLTFSCTKNSNTAPETATISFKIEFSGSSVKQAAADSVVIFIYEDNQLYETLIPEIGDSTATASVELDFGKYDFRVELYLNSDKIYFGEKNGFDVNINTFNVTISVYPVPVLNANTSEIDFGDVVTGQYSSVSTFLLSGTNIIDSVFINSPDGFEISKDTVSANFKMDEISFSLAEFDSVKTVYVRGKAAAPGQISGFVSCSTKEAEDVFIFLKLNGI